jgi:hypothetical protein
MFFYPENKQIFALNGRVKTNATWMNQRVLIGTKHLSMLLIKDIFKFLDELVQIDSLGIN